MKDRFQEIAKHKLEGFQVTPPPAVWNRVEETLEHKKKQRKFIVMRRNALVAAAVALPLFFGAYWFTKQERFVGQRVQTVVENKDNRITPTIIKETENNSYNESIENQLPTIEPPLNTLPPKGVNDGSRSSNVYSTTDRKVKREFIVLALLPTVEHKLETQNTPLKINLKGWEQYKQDQAIIAANLNRMSTAEKPKKRYQSAIKTQYAAVALVSANAGQAGGTNYELDGGINYVIKGDKKVSFETGIHITKMSKSKEGGDFSAYTPALENYLGVTAKQQPNVHNNIWGQVVMKRADQSKANFSEEYYGATISADIDQSAHYLEVPLVVKYNLLESKFGVDVLGGINTNFLVNNLANVSNSNGSFSTNTKGLKTVTNSSVVGFSLHYDVGTKLRVSLDPRAKYYFSNLTDSNNSVFKPVIIGVYTGVSYNF